MRKVLVIASREYQAAVRTKAFLISMIVLPTMIGGSVVIQLLFKDMRDTTDKHVVVIDRTPGESLLERIAAAADERNQHESPAFLIERGEPGPDDAEAIERRRFEFVMIATVLAGFWSMMSGTFFLMTLRAAGLLA